MKFNDAAFFEPEPQRYPARLSPADLAQIPGLVDPITRRAEAYLDELGVDVTADLAPEPAMLGPGERVQFQPPDQPPRRGAIREIQGADALVEVDDGEFAVVPLVHLAKVSRVEGREMKRSAIQSALRGQSAMAGYANELYETRALLPLDASGRDFAMTLGFHAGYRPADDEVEAFVAQRYPGARVIDADDRFPQRLAVILHFAQGLDRSAQNMVPIHGPKDPPSDRDRNSPVDTETERSAGETREAELALLHRSGTFFHQFAEAYPRLDFIETAIEREPGLLISHFEVRAEQAPLFVLAGPQGLTFSRVLRAGSAPAVGTLVTTAEGFDARLHGPHGQVPITVQALFDTGSGPFSMHEDDPAQHDGHYVTHADHGVVGDFEPDGATRDLPVPTKEQWLQEKQRYEEEQRQIEEKNRRRREIKRETQDLPKPQPWIETDASAPAAGDVEHLGGPGLQVAERRAIDDNARAYWRKYFESSDYGEDLTRDVTGEAEPEAREAHRARGARVLKMWRSAAGTPPPAPVLARVTRFLTDGPRVIHAQANDLVQSLQLAHQNDPSAQNAIDKLVTDYLAKNPEAINLLAPDAFSKVLTDAVNYTQKMNPKALESLRMKVAPGETPIETGNQPGMWQRLKEKVSPRQRMEREIETGAIPGLEPVPGLAPNSEDDFFGEPLEPNTPEQPARPAQPAGRPPMVPSNAPAPPPPPQWPPQSRSLFDAPEPSWPPRGPEAPPSWPPRGPASPPSDWPPAPPLGGEGVGAHDFRSPTSVFPQRHAPPLGGPGVGAHDFSSPTGVQDLPLSGGTPLGGPGVGAHDFSEPTRGYGGGGRFKSPLPPGARRAPLAHLQGGDTVRIAAGKPVLTERGTLRALAAPLEGRVLSVEADGVFILTAGEVLKANADALEVRAAEKPPKAKGRRPNAKSQLRFKVENLHSAGGFLVMEVGWDPKATEGMSARSIEHSLIAFLKEKASRGLDELGVDFGHIGRPRIDMLDLHTGLAELRVRSSESRALPPEVITKGPEFHVPIA
jgi:hypothetical protein